MADDYERLVRIEKVGKLYRTLLRAIEDAAPEGHDRRIAISTLEESGRRCAKAIKTGNAEWPS